MNERLPKGYSVGIVKGWGDFLFHKRKDELVESIRLTDRTFSQTDHYLGYLPSQIIEYLIKRNGRIRIADIGGGRKSLCAEEIAETYKENATVVNVDLLHSPERFRLPNLFQISGDVIDIPIPSKTIDFALCYQLLPNLDDRNNHEKAIAAVREIARILKPGGVALIDETYLSSRCFNFLDETIRNLAIETETFMWPRQGNNSEPGKMVMGGPSSFLMIEKRPQDFNLPRIREKIIGHF